MAKLPNSAVEIICGIVVLTLGYWVFVHRPGGGVRELESVFAADLPKYLALESARRAPLAHIPANYREPLERDPTLRRNVLEDKSTANMQKRSLEGPLVLVDPSARRISSSTLALSDDLRAASPEAVKTVVWWDCKEEVVGRYNKGGEDATRWNCLATVFDFRTGEWVAENAFTGGAPPDTIVNRRSASGSVPTQELERWIRQGLKP